MKKCFSTLTKVKRGLAITQQTDITLPRGSTTSLMTLLPFLPSLSSATSALSSPVQLQQSLSSPTTSLLLSSLNFHYNISPQSEMENNPQDTEKVVKDQLNKDGCGKEASCDDNQQKRASDFLIPHILNLYASRATPQDYEIYAPHATFEDPLMRAHGVKQIKSSFYSLGKVFSESRIVSYDVEENVISPGKMEILIDNKQYYKFLGKDIDMISLIKLYTENGKIVRHEDWWDKKPIWNRDTVKAPLVGRFIEATRRVSMFATHALMRFGKDPTM